MRDQQIRAQPSDRIVVVDRTTAPQPFAVRLIQRRQLLVAGEHRHLTSRNEVARLNSPRRQDRAGEDLQRQDPRRRHRRRARVRPRPRRLPQGDRQDHRRPRHAVDVLRLPVAHHKHLRTTNVTESTFATVRLRQRTTKRPGCRDAGVAIAYKLLDAGRARWRRINGHELVALVRAGAPFIDRRLQERTATDAHADAA